MDVRIAESGIEIFVIRGSEFCLTVVIYGRYKFGDKKVSLEMG